MYYLSNLPFLSSRHRHKDNTHFLDGLYRIDTKFARAFNYYNKLIAIYLNNDFLRQTIRILQKNNNSCPS